ncbi:PilZ domain-containing protein [Pelagerythrobacter rhizovicinus]|uniref:PilZ domain-containing protein n=1 Tax=Pelagerythrobacter rhizovicinus TaxID=2268576 RepID=UPI0013EA3DCD|nr:PilZ domain-containing protein [Pelagerythrobacter rhizovicinus]
MLGTDKVDSAGTGQVDYVALLDDYSTPFGRKAKLREPRTSATLYATLRVHGRERAACIRNLSPRGMMIEAGSIPLVGQRIEVRVGRTILLGRVVWRKVDRFGVHFPHRIDVAYLLHRNRRRTAQVALGICGTGGSRDYHLVARTIQFAASIGIALSVTATIAWVLHEALASPMQTIASSLSPVREAE